MLFDVWTGIAPMIAGMAMDLLFGDPQDMPHPVRLIGKGIAGAEGFLRKHFPADPEGEKAAGRALVLLILAGTFGACCLLLRGIPAACGALLGKRPARYIRLAAETVMMYYLMAVRSLRDESMKVYYALKEGSLGKARHAVSMIVGRDTDRLSAEGVTKAAVETIAEGTSDGVIAPLFWYALLGPVGGWLYKACNTMDSMVGYRNERYLWFGRAAARLDDAVNYVPSRLAAVLMIAASFLTGTDARGAFRIWKRDRRNHKSPNSAQTESVCAGALGLRLAGDAWYFGKKVEKPYIGDETRRAEAEDIPRANRLMLCTSALGFCLAAAVRAVLLLAGALRR